MKLTILCTLLFMLFLAVGFEFIGRMDWRIFAFALFALILQVGAVEMASKVLKND